MFAYTRVNCNLCKTARQAERWGFPREYTEKRLEELQSVDAHPDQDGGNKSASGQRGGFSIWKKYGNASRIVLDNSTLLLNKYGNESLFMTPTRPASVECLRPSHFLLVSQCPSSFPQQESKESIRVADYLLASAVRQGRGDTTVHELVARQQHARTAPAASHGRRRGLGKQRLARKRY